MTVIAVWASVRRFLPLAGYAAIAVLIGLCSHFAHRASANAQAMRDQARQFTQAQELAAQAAQAERNRLASDYQAKAMEAENAYETEKTDAREALNRYVATHRLRPATVASGSSVANAATQHIDPDLPESMPTSSILVSTADMQACTDAVSYAVKAHDWAISLDQQNDR